MTAAMTALTAAATPWRGSMPRETAEEWAWLIQDGCSIDEVARHAGRGKATVWRAVQRVTGQKVAALRQLQCVDCGTPLTRVPRQRDGRCTACRALRRQQARLAAHDLCANCGGRMVNHREMDGRPRFCERCGDAPYTRWRSRNDPVYQQFNRDYTRWNRLFRQGRTTEAEKPRLAAYRAGHVPEAAQRAHRIGQRRVRTAPPAPCSVAGCGREASRRGWCDLHYCRWKRHGDVGPPEARTQRAASCSVSGCPHEAVSDGWCASHGYRVRVYGEPLAQVPLGSLQRSLAAERVRQIVALVRERRLSQRAIARQLGVGRSTVQAIASGKRHAAAAEHTA